MAKPSVKSTSRKKGRSGSAPSVNSESSQPSTEERIAALERKSKDLMDHYTVPCPHCSRPILASQFAAAAASRANAMRKTRGAGGGRPKKLVPCPKCRREFGVAELRAHKPHCGL